MGRRSFNRKPVAPKRELSGFEKTKRKREISLRSERDAAIAAKFFRKSSENFPSCSSGLEKSDKTNPELLVDQVVPDLGLIPAQQDWCPSVRRSTSVSGLLVDTAENSNLSDYNFSTSSVELDLKSNDEHDNLTSKSQTLFAEDNVDVTFESKQDELDACDFDPSDPSTWTIPITLHQLNMLRDSKPKQSSFDFIETNERTAFNPNIFMSPGGRKREWLLFSKSTNSLFCYCCSLFPVKLVSCCPWINVGKGKRGFSDYRRQTRGVVSHEKSDQHFQCTLKWKEYEQVCKQGNSLDQSCKDAHLEEKSFWRKVLRGLLDAVMYLSKNNLAFQGANADIGSVGCGNFLSLVELLSRYYPPLAIHVSRVKQNEVRTTYLSAKTQNEFIELAARNVRVKVLDAIKQRKYFSIMFDATPDISHMEQISEVIRTVHISDKGCRIEENFLRFVHFDLKTGLEISKVIMDVLSKDGLDIKNCRGQGYDNGSNMAGVSKGVQARIKELNANALFVPCSAHSLNLVGQNAACKVLAPKLILGVIQNLYNFFSNSPFRWNTMKKFVKRGLKCQSATRWSSKFSAVFALVEEFQGIAESLMDLMNSESSNAHTMAEANSLYQLIYNFRFILSIVVWKAVLERINICNQVLQLKTCSIDDAAKHLEGLVLWLVEYKTEGFSLASLKAKRIAESCEIDEASGFETRTTRGRIPIRFRADSDTPQPQEVSNEQRFKIDFFDQLLDALINDFSHRFQAIKFVNESFNFLWGSKLATSTSQELAEAVKSLVGKYQDDLSESDFLVEIGRLRTSLLPFLKDKVLSETNSMDILNILAAHGLLSLFPNTVIALQIFLTLPVTVATNERAFSKLKIIKNYLRNRMGQDRLSNLSILSIEHEVVKQIDFDGVISDFANAKCRRVQI